MSAGTDRRYEFDWLRVLAILVVFLYHSSRFFNIGDWHVKNADTFVWVEMWNVFATRWMMPLFFVISGASLFYAMEKSKGLGRFYVDKFLRLMVPVVFGSFTFSILQVYLEKLTHGRFSGSFFSFIPEYFNGLYLGIGLPGNFAFHGLHLWYLLFLFIYTLICYPFFKWFKGNGGRILTGITSVLAVPGFIYVGFSIPLVILKMLIPSPVIDVGNGGWGFIYYIWFLISGFVIVSGQRLQQRIIDDRWISLLLGMMLSSVHLYQLFGTAPVVLPSWITDWLGPLLSFLSAWAWLFAILGFSMKLLAFDRPLLRYANEGVLPFYILHQTVLLCVGYFVLSQGMNTPIKWAIIFLGAFVVILLCYTLLVRKFELLRFLFGMKTTHPFFERFRKRGAVIILHVLYISLIIYAAAGGIQSRSPMPLKYDPYQDIVLNAASITNHSSSGVHVVGDEAASIGKAIEFLSGANPQAEPHPEVYVEMQFPAQAGQYIVWLRGKTNIDDGYTDSVWMQVDDQIGLQGRGARMGNWLDVHPAGDYGWAGDADTPVIIELKHAGMHAIRIQPRQTPHRIDQIWFSRFQHRIPDTVEYLK